VIDLKGLVASCGFSEPAEFQQAHRQWVEDALRGELSVRDARWSEAIAVGSLAFTEKVKGELGVKAMHREPEQVDGTYALREPGEAYRGEFNGESDALRAENTLPWQRITETAETYRGPTRFRRQNCLFSVGKPLLIVAAILIIDPFAVKKCRAANFVRSQNNFGTL
jgi:hypothetical protein